ncbi:hypothetical protein [Tenacibaculum sp. 190524A02b]|uniref:hypothetical protein n=1 Tax=Tenacibaculum vairaonense TaxID=3137860 RepID=UPI0032B1D340
MIKLIRANKVPKTCYNSLDLSKVNFVGRELKLGVSCRWMGINKCSMSLLWTNELVAS